MRNFDFGVLGFVPVVFEHIVEVEPRVAELVEPAVCKSVGVFDLD